MLDKFKDVYRKTGDLEKWMGVFALLGVLVAFVGLFRGILVSRQVQIEYLNTDKKTTEEIKIVVDIEGAVNKPGVYELLNNSRIKDILVLAGGYSEKADRTYCEKMINLASTLKDAQKIYIPFVNDTPKVLGYTEANSATKLINMNTASDSELDTLWGIGESRIENIVKNRPYQSVEELVTKKVFTKQILEKNKEMIVVY